VPLLRRADGAVPDLLSLGGVCENADGAGPP
jgi:hypothetical protein